MVGMMKLGIQGPAAVECLEEFVVTQMSRGEHERHKAIMTDASRTHRRTATPLYAAFRIFSPAIDRHPSYA